MGKKTIYILGFFIILATILGYNYYQKIFGSAITETTILYVTTSDSLVDVQNKITPFSNKPNTFLWVAAKKNVSKPKAGRYVLKKGMSNNDLINMLRSGWQTPLKLSFNNQDTLEKFAGRIAQQLAVDSISLMTAFTDQEFLSKNKLTEKSVLQIFIPNTYELYWTVSAEKFRAKMLSEYHRFWNADRLQKAKNLNMTKDEVITLASIVHKETTKKTERPIVAGLYLNRLKKGIPLQADPTVIYCVKQVKGQDYEVKRVLLVDLEINSPYNTYKKRGLPPTLIAMPDISAIDAVLNPAKHNYYYMCADADNIGYHKFAKTLTQHNKNATQYQHWLNKNSIKR
ncbi:endolytic transglycosylase MltG [uncultured Polaribacter sp.]|uniref:endolytic transglycosylase MltG n=1 Tax=uncultured Polaribacter sp. TaxID=174711 RepID=UPI00261786F7|nr:endolytic transglycosylase MltG [uncultured Polaribacter sp.]